MMTKEEFIKKVMALAEDKNWAELDKLYDEVIGKGLNYPEVQTLGGQKVTVTWGTS